MKISEVIRAAIPHMENGWCRDELTDDQGNVCARGALLKASSGVASWDGYHPGLAMSYADEALSTKAREITGDDTLDIVEYNNHVALDVDDVIALFEKTAQDLEVQGK